MEIKNYRHMEVGKEYRVFNSVGDSFVFVFQGSFANEEEHNEIFISFGGADVWHTDEFTRAIDNVAAQAAYTSLCNSVLSAMNEEQDSFVIAVLKHEEYAKSSLVRILHNAGKKIIDLQNYIQTKILYSDDGNRSI